MTDTDIKKALECCSAESLAQKKCKQCPYHKRSSVQCIGQLCKDALELIKRQQADKIMLEQSRVTLPERIKIVDNARKHAVREFTEVMKENLQNVAKEEIMGREYYLIGLSFIDNLVKEFAKGINVSTNPEQPKEAEKETTTAKHRVGDRVRVRYDLSVGDYGNTFCNANMISQAGKILTIAKEPDSFGRYRVKECGYIWNDLMFEDELAEGDTPWLL